MNSNKSTGCILIGGTGYGAKEFLRLASFHPEIEIIQIISKSASDTPVSSSHPELEGIYSLSFEKEPDFEKLKNHSHRFIVLALPHGESVNFVAEYEEKVRSLNIHIIDLSGDFRLKDHNEREQWYGPLSDNISKACYERFTFGLTELDRASIKKATHIANPGCYATAAILAIAPISNSFKLQSIVVDGKSGSSGGGKNPSQAFHHPELHSNAFSYKALDHRHEPEIIDHASIDKDCSFMFVPHVIPLSRGMLVTCYFQLVEEISAEDIHATFERYYQESPFVRIRKNPPQIRQVAGSNFCDLHITVRNKQVVVTSCIDNLIKGMAGQAIQNINCIADLDETTGLLFPGLGVV
jgi:N-acetyl-gamma-glutamyl-phosphate reductase